MFVTGNVRSIASFGAGLAMALIAIFVLHDWRAEAAPGDSDTTFVPIYPCRLADTRPEPDRVGPNATLGPNDTRNIQATGGNGNCGIPDDATGLSLNVTAIGATAPTFITIWPQAGQPEASSLNPSPGEPPTPNAVTTALSEYGRFDIYNLAGAVDVIIDVNGYYTNSSIRNLATRVASLEEQVASLEQSQPQAYFTNPGLSDAVSDWELVAELEFDRPTSQGHVIVNYVANVIEPDVGETAQCQLGSSEGPSLVPSQSFVSTGSVGLLSGTAGFGLIGGSPQVEIRLQCSSTDAATISDASITATLFPST